MQVAIDRTKDEFEREFIITCKVPKGKSPEVKRMYIYIMMEMVVKKEMSIIKNFSASSFSF